MNKKWIASLACVCLLASSFTAAVAEGMKPVYCRCWIPRGNKIYKGRI